MKTKLYIHHLPQQDNIANAVTMAYKGTGEKEFKKLWNEEIQKNKITITKSEIIYGDIIPQEHWYIY